MSAGSTAEVFLRRAVEQALQRTPRPGSGTGEGQTLAGASVALAVRDSVRPTDQPFVETVLTGMQPVLASAGLRVLSLFGHTDDVYWTLAEHIERWRLAGMVLVSLHDGDPLPVLLASAGFPAVTIGRCQVPDLPWVDADNVGGARAAVSHLIDNGYRRIATITGPLNQQAMVDRLAGYRQARADAGLPADAEVVVEGNGTVGSGRHAMGMLLEAHPDVDAVFCGSEIMAEGAMQVLDAVRPAPEIGVVTFDDGEVSRRRHLTAVAQPVSGMGSTAAELLLEVLGGGTPVGRSVPSWLVVRASSAPRVIAAR